MPSSRFQFLLLLFPVMMLAGVAQAGPLVAGFHTEDRSLNSPVPDPTGIKNFGLAVAVNDGIALVGAMGECNSGNAYLYDSHTGTLLHNFTFDREATSEFGRAVALEGAYAVVGSTNATYVYDIDRNELLHTFPRSQDFDIDGERLLIASSYDNYIYDLRSGEQLAVINSAAASVALSGDYMILAAGGILDRPGTAWVINWKNEEWLHRLTPPGMPNGVEFGNSVAADNNRVIVGSINRASRKGDSVYVFDLTTGENLHRLEPPSSVDYRAKFGKEISVHGDVAILSAYRQRFLDDSNRGAAYAYSLQTGEELARFTTSDPKTIGTASYGSSIDFDGNQIIAGNGGWPKKAYLTNFVIPEPCSVSLLSAVVIAIISRRHKTT